MILLYDNFVRGGAMDFTVGKPLLRPRPGHGRSRTIPIFIYMIGGSRSKKYFLGHRDKMGLREF